MRSAGYNHSRGCLCFSSAIQNACVCVFMIKENKQKAQRQDGFKTFSELTSAQQETQLNTKGRLFRKSSEVLAFVSQSDQAVTDEPETRGGFCAGSVMMMLQSYLILLFKCCRVYTSSCQCVCLFLYTVIALVMCRGSLWAKPDLYDSLVSHRCSSSLCRSCTARCCYALKKDPPVAFTHFIPQFEVSAEGFMRAAGTEPHLFGILKTPQHLKMFNIYGDWKRLGTAPSSL